MKELFISITQKKCQLFLAEKYFKRDSVEIEIFSQLVFQISSIRILDILG